MVIENQQKIISKDFNLGKKIAYFRNLKGYSQEDLAKKIGKTRGTISAYENNIADITVPILLLIAKSLKITLYDLVYELDSKEEQASEPGITYNKDLENEVKHLKAEIILLRKELNDKNKIIDLYESGKMSGGNKEVNLEIKIQKLEKIVNNLINKISS